MSSLFVFNESFTNGYRGDLLDFISLTAILCGILVIITKNPVVSVLFLIGLFLSISGYLIVRFCVLCYDGFNKSEQYANLFPASELSRRENRLLNLASPPKGGISSNRKERVVHRAEFPMVKATLLKVYSLGAYLAGPYLVLNRVCESCKSWWLRFLHCIEFNRDTICIHNVKSGQPKGNINITKGTGGLPKAPKSYGNRGRVVPEMGRLPGNGVRNYSSTAGGSSTVSTDSISKLGKILELCNNNPNFVVEDKLYKLLYDKNLYEVAYKKLRSKPGNMTPGIPPTTLDGFSSEVINEIIGQLRAGTFKFSPGRRVSIPKPNGGTIPLTVAPPRDKIVQEVMRIILEAIYEPSFSATSHGFRPEKSCHSALKDIKTKFQIATWFIEGDIAQCFPSIDHNKLMEILGMRIKDQRFLELIRKSLKAGYMEFTKYNHSVVGTPQGSIISPILSNIYLDQLDKFMEQLEGEFNIDKAPTRNPVYQSLQYKKRKATTIEEKSRIHKLLLQTPSKQDVDPNFKRLVYVRYADDWIVGVRGSLEDSKLIMAKIKAFLKSELLLDISEAKTLITSLRHDSARFLGVDISRNGITTFGRRNRGFLTINDKTLRLTAPISRIRQKLTRSGFISEGKANPKWIWLANTKDEIILLYNAVYRDIMQYYGFASNLNHLSARIHWELKTSCVKLLAAKFSLNTQAAVYKKFGKDLKGEDKHGFIPITLGIDTWGFKVGVQDILLRLNARGISKASLDNLICAKCKSDYRVEMHHVRMMI